MADEVFGGLIDKYFQKSIMLTNELNLALKSTVMTQFRKLANPFPIHDLVNAIKTERILSNPRANVDFKVYYFKKENTFEYFINSFGFCFDLSFNPTDCTGQLNVGPLDRHYPRQPRIPLVKLLSLDGLKTEEMNQAPLVNQPLP